MVVSSAIFLPRGVARSMPSRFWQWPHNLPGSHDRKSCGWFLMTPWVFLVAPKLHKHVKKKTARGEPPCKNDDRHEIVSFGALVGLSPHFVDQHSETVVKKS
jgi:hypothetical protein